MSLELHIGYKFGEKRYRIKDWKYQGSLKEGNTKAIYLEDIIYEKLSWLFCAENMVDHSEEERAQIIRGESLTVEDSRKRIGLKGS